jgi:hypothetical protein
MWLDGAGDALPFPRQDRGLEDDYRLVANFVIPMVMLESVSAGDHAGDHRAGSKRVFAKRGERSRATLRRRGLLRE